MIHEASKTESGAWAQNFEGVPTLAIFRQAPFKFSLYAVSQIASPFQVFYNQDFSQQGAIDLIEFFKNLAINTDEVWSSQALESASEAQTMFIVFSTFKEITLDTSIEFLTVEQLQERHPESTIFITHVISDESLIALVNELLEFMKA